MASLPFSIEVGVRNQRLVLIQFFDVLHLHLASGYEVNHAWTEAVDFFIGSGNPIGNKSEYNRLATREAGFEEHVLRLSRDPYWGRHAGWFQVLGTLYANGAGMLEAVKGIVNSLRKEDTNDLECHLRALPMKMQVVLILFFFPPTILLLILPILFGIAL